MVIEWLKFKINQEREKFIEKDAEIWTASLSKYPGFLGKEIWINPNNESEIIFIIRWKTREEWKAIPQSILDETEKKFAQALENRSYEMLESKEYQVRKFP
ncbi:TIGR03792 family protein [Aphanothece hegewaldii CCALA 016]|uniref:TIGR03792 family protein n=1 Tax=Aphanothece hegewaldii CCALA 016 TaxID=2107694 RepID=A0A2T1M281_9CHRO|nr:TIGR03792 family protein [Aphanothece hegewaldii]PSF38853.1 TIGR03792 family protein [Aphanothece hegewaldii CCALA 016]